MPPPVRGTHRILLKLANCGQGVCGLLSQCTRGGPTEFPVMALSGGNIFHRFLVRYQTIADVHRKFSGAGKGTITLEYERTCPDALANASHSAGGRRAAPQFEVARLAGVYPPMNS
jgi:hypothetical protein